MVNGHGDTKEEAIKNAIINQFPAENISIGDFSLEDSSIYGVIVHFPEKDKGQLVRVEVMRSDMGWTAEILQ